MPSSDPNMIPKVLSVVSAINPKSILDVGIGNGRYGFLFRESLDWNWGRLTKDSWELALYGVEIDPAYLSPIHNYLYNQIAIDDFLSYRSHRKFDLVFLGDILEHWPDGKWEDALSNARDISRFTVVVSPNWIGSLGQGAWHGHSQEKHLSVLSPAKVGGRCLFASSKMFMCAFDNEYTGILEDKDICL